MFRRLRGHPRRPRRASLLSLTVGGLCAAVLPAVVSAAPGDVTVALVKDINPAVEPGDEDSNPSGLTNVNGTLFFRADDGTSNGDELWKSDGTASGTKLVKNIRIGGDSNPSRLTNVNGILFFRADDGTNGEELWKSDGTPAGTVMVEDGVPGGGINPGSGSSNPNNLINVNGTLFFSADDGTNGFELWKSDGTPAGTTIVEDAVPGGGLNPGAADSSPGIFAVVNSTLYMTADDGTNGFELWKSDGTPAGTTIVEDAVPGGGINPGAAQSGPNGLVNVNGTLFFSADDGTNGRELWKSDGTPAGTTIVEDAVPGSGIRPGSDGSSPDTGTNFNGILYFGANDGTNGDELWKSDGTPAGTAIVEDAVPGGGINPGSASSFPNVGPNANGTLYMTADDGTNGFELWKSDGTPAGTTIVEDVVPGGGINPGAASSDPFELANVNGTLFFDVDDGTNGRELWRTNGTPAGTTIVEDSVPGGGINPGGSGSEPLGLTNVNGTLFFGADDGTNGRELWRTIEGPAPPPPATTPAPTGEREAALKKCKKKKTKKKRKKCKKKAQKLPV